MKRKHFFSILMILLITLISGCDFSSSSSSFVYQGPIVEVSSYQNTYYQARRAQGYKSQTPTKGEVPILVIPISFSDAPFDDIEYGYQQIMSDIDKAFFGTSEQTNWESVSSFYDKSSYGQLLFYGEVAAQPYTPTISSVDLKEGKNGANVLNNVVKPALSWYRQTFNDSLARFDSDDDGYLDAIYFIYSVPVNDIGYEIDENKVLWAFTSYDNNAVRDLAHPGLFHFGWSSYDFMYKDGLYERDEQGRVLRDGETNNPIFHPYQDDQGHYLVDAHTFIHEFGHFLGLPDYYSYDNKIGDYDSVGSTDMMDYNIGDHNAFSKAIFGWIYPKVVIEPTTLNLKPLVSEGESFIIPINYKETLLDEYLLLEYYQPIGLNKRDSELQFAGRYPKTPQEAGLKIYHVDARIGRYVYSKNSWVFYNYVDKIGQISASVHYGIANSNSASRSAVSYHKLIELLEKNGQSSFRHGGIATNETLFKLNDRFDEDNFPNYQFNNGHYFPYNIIVSQLDQQQITIQISNRDLNE